MKFKKSQEEIATLGVVLFRTRLKVSSCLWDARVPLLVCSAYGMVGMMRLLVKEHTGDGNLCAIRSDFH
jgi:hypothetical protein